MGQQHIAGDEDQLEGDEEREEVAGEEGEHHAGGQHQQQWPGQLGVGAPRSAPLSDGEELHHQDRGHRDQQDERRHQIDDEDDADDFCFASSFAPETQ